MEFRSPTTGNSFFGQRKAYALRAVTAVSPSMHYTSANGDDQTDLPNSWSTDPPPPAPSTGSTQFQKHMAQARGETNMILAYSAAHGPHSCASLEPDLDTECTVDLIDTGQELWPEEKPWLYQDQWPDERSWLYQDQWPDLGPEDVGCDTEQATRVHEKRGARTYDAASLQFAASSPSVEHRIEGRVSAWDIPKLLPLAQRRAEPEQ